MSLLKNFLNPKTKNEIRGVRDPQIGFQLSYNITTAEMTVKILGAKLLPTNYGNTKPQGYLIKVTVFPQKEKFETKIVEQSWPTFNEEFKFKIQSPSKYGDCLKGKFISFTAYAILYGEQSKEKGGQNFFKRFMNFGEGNRKKEARSRRSFRHSLNNKRTIGGVTYNLELKKLSIKLGDFALSTPEIWRDLREISSGIANSPKDNKKGNVEVTMLYSLSESRDNDLIEISVSKLRCNIQTMEEHERLGGKLYLKISAFERDDVIQKMKSDKFDPTISLKMEKSTAKLKVKVDDQNYKQLRIIIRLMCTPLMSQKLELGKIEIDSRSELWKEMMITPMIPVTKVLSLG